MIIDIENPEHVYMLGYFWADCYFGYNKDYLNFSFEIKTSDFIEIWPMLQTMGFESYKTRCRLNSKNTQSIVRSGVQKDLKVLESWNYQNKSENCIFYYTLSDDLKKYFIKGFLDGDGSISVDKNKLFRVCFYGLENQNWSFLSDFCNQYDINHVIYRKTRKSQHKSHKKDSHSYSIFEFTKLQDRINFCKVLYDVNVGLLRKMDIFEKYRKHRIELQTVSKYAKQLIF